MLLGAASMAVDAGYLRYMQRVQQSAADSAAIAGANELAYPTANDVTAAAKADAASNGFTHDGSNVVVTVNTPPGSGSYAGNANAVEVTVRANHGMFFERLLGVAAKSVTTRAVSVFGNANGAGDCIYQLKTSGAANLNSTTIHAPTCGIIANGNLNVNSATVTAASIGAVGSISQNSSTFTEAQPAHSIAAIDPCPTMAGCTYLANNPPATSPCTFSNVNKNSWTGTLDPGVYCGPLNLNSSNVTFNPGLYVMTNGINANSSTMTGTGVTFYIASGALNVNSATLNLTAPATGNTIGMLFFAPTSNATAANLNSSGGSTIAGGIYFPNATFNSNSSFNTWVLIVAGLINMNSSSIDVPSNSTFPGGSRHAILAE
jgi:hypothetical protein